MKMFRVLLLVMLAASLGLFGCSDDGDDGAPGAQGPPGPPGSSIIDITTAPDAILANVPVVSEITGVTIASPPVVNFTVTTADGRAVTGIGALWEDSDRFVRFTITKLLPGTNGNPDSWVAYTRDTLNDGSTPPDYDTGSSLVDNGDGSYVFTFKTDVNAVTGVPYEPALTHRVAGQIGSGSSALEAQNLFLDFVPNGGPVTNTRNIAVMDSCNECHDGLVFHGRRFVVEYCVNCHNPDLALTPGDFGEGNMSFMIHRIHSAGAFDVLDGGFQSEATYPQDTRNCRKCHNGDDVATAEGFNWKNVPNIAGCSGCHDVFDDGSHTGGPVSDNNACAICHPPEVIEGYHTTANATPNNPNLLPGQYDVAYEIIDATVDAGGVPTINFSITFDGVPQDMNALPADILARRPGFLLSWAQPQGAITTPAEYTNFPNSAGQPTSVSLTAADSLTCAGGICTAILTSNPYPAGSTMRAVGLQGYFQQDINGATVSLHTTSVVAPVTGDDARRVVVDNNKCAACHEFFEGHGGNRNFDIAICTMCHVPNLSSSGRAVDPAAAAARPSDAFLKLGLPTTDWPEDTNNLKDMIHGIHSSAFRTSDYEFVRGRNDGIYYNWAEVTFPAEDGTSNCALCHVDGTFVIPTDPNLLESTVRTTAQADGLDTDFAVVDAARDTVPNAVDWVNSPISSACAYCHDSDLAGIHMEQNGGQLSVANPAVGVFTNRSALAPAESCAVCHGPGKTADVEMVHGL